VAVQIETAVFSSCRREILRSAQNDVDGYVILNILKDLRFADRLWTNERT
jgi:hypothetical protein